MFPDYLSKRFLSISALILVLVLAACGDDAANSADAGSSDLDGPIVFGDFNWDSAIYHNRVAQHIIENGYGYETDSIQGSTIPVLQGMQQEDIDVVTEMWVENMPEWYFEEVEEGVFVDLGPNYTDSIQGWMVPTYMIEGDAERGIEPMAPDLKHVDDLPQYAHLFEDPEVPELGRSYNGITGWESAEVNEAKFISYGLDEHYNSFMVGSEAGLFTSLTTAYQAGEPWLGAFWAPTWQYAQFDLTMLEEPEYTDECWEDIYDETIEGCAYPDVRVNVVVTPDFESAAPDVTEFLTNYESTTAETSEAMLYMADNDASPEEAAAWWVENNVDTWSEWVPEDIAENLQESFN